MMKISRLTDYAIIILSYLATHSAVRYSAAILAEQTHIAAPTVRKLLKLMNEAGFLTSARGTNGGYQLSKAPENISLVQVIRAIDGWPAMTECCKANSDCIHSKGCGLRGNWQIINQIVLTILDRLTLFDITQSLIDTDYILNKLAVKGDING